jgi:haloacid dehalogenase-like hydrolase
VLSRIETVIPEAAFSRLSSASAFIFDVDRTLAEPHKEIGPDIVRELEMLRVPAGVATARTLSELEESLPQGKSLQHVFRGDILLEDGGVLVPCQQPLDTPLRVEALVSVSELGAIAAFRELLVREFHDLGRADGFGRLGDVSEPLVKFPPYRDFLTSITLWEKGPVGDPAFARVYRWCAERLVDLSLQDTLTLTEVGDGTLRVTVPGVHKGSGIEELARRKRLDVGHMAYFGDGHNDVSAAATVKAHGGIVVAVGSSTPALVSLADYVTREEGPGAVHKILERLNRASR